MAGREWTVEFHPKCEQWAQGLPANDAEALLAAVRVLRGRGPSLGRQLVDTVKGSTEIRVLFAFDKKRMAILLVGGDKSDNWAGWYDANIPIADERFKKHQATLDTTSVDKRKKKRR